MSRWAEDTSNTLDWRHIENRFEEMGQEKERPISQFWEWAQVGDAMASQTGLMIMQLKPDFEIDMMAIGGTHRDAKRVSRHLLKMVTHLEGVRSEFQKLPATIMKVYEPQIQQARQKVRNNKRAPITLTA